MIRWVLTHSDFTPRVRKGSPQGRGEIRSNGSILGALLPATAGEGFGDTFQIACRGDSNIGWTVRAPLRIPQHPWLKQPPWSRRSNRAAQLCQGPIKVPGVAYPQSYARITYEDTPHSPPCGPPSPHGRGIEIRITALSQGRGFPTGEGRRGVFSKPTGL